MILFFGGKIVLICKILLNFILKIKKEDEKIHLTHCVTDFIESGDRIMEICTVCFIKILVQNKFLKRFVTEKKVRDETYYLYLWMFVGPFNKDDWRRNWKVYYESCYIQPYW